MSNYPLPSVIYHGLSGMLAKKELQVAVDAAFEQLNRGHITSIANAFFQHTKICVNGVPYIKVKGLSTILRTGGSGVERALVYNGMPGVVPRSEIIEIEGEDHISGPSLIALIQARMHFQVGKTYQYLRMACEIYTRIINSVQVRDLKDLFLSNIEECRPGLKSERVEKYGISCCEFSGATFTNLSQVEFAHVFSVATNPSRALDITNGVIILKSIHAELTRRGIHDFAGMYAYCLEKSYSTAWANAF